MPPVASAAKQSRMVGALATDKVSEDVVVAGRGGLKMVKTAKRCVSSEKGKLRACSMEGALPSPGSTCWRCRADQLRGLPKSVPAGPTTLSGVKWAWTSVPEAGSCDSAFDTVMGGWTCRGRDRRSASRPQQPELLSDMPRAYFLLIGSRFGLLSGSFVGYLEKIQRFPSQEHCAVVPTVGRHGRPRWVWCVTGLTSADRQPSAANRIDPGAVASGTQLHGT